MTIIKHDKPTTPRPDSTPPAQGSIIKDKNSNWF